VNFVSHARERILEPAIAAFDHAVDDTVDQAQTNADRYSKSGKFADSITRTEPVQRGDRLTARIGSPLVSARAKEKGAFIQAKRGPYLVFNAGDGVRKVGSVRVPPRPVVGPAVKRFPQFMRDRLVERLR
jgi:hypothetical protein